MARRGWAWCLALGLVALPIHASPTPDSETDGLLRDLVSSTVADGLELPWGMEFMPDGRLLVTERVGRLRLIDPQGDVARTIEGLPAVRQRGHGGLLDVTVDPDFSANRFLYLSYTEQGRSSASRGNGLTVARARLSEDATRLEGFRVLFRQRPRAMGDENLGGRLAVSSDGHLFITVGDRRTKDQRRRAQDLRHYHGKTLRIRTDGSVPSSNPFARRRGARPEIWSLGHRNPQGAFVHPDTGQLWTAEHGPFGGDEVNIVPAGGNHGWPVATFGCEYDSCAPIGRGAYRPGMLAPLAYWGRPGIAPSNLILYTGELLPDWKGSILVAALAGQAVWRLQIAGEGPELHVVRQEAVLPELGERIRDLRQGPDGAIYLLTDGAPARVVRIGRLVQQLSDRRPDEATP